MSVKVRFLGSGDSMGSRGRGQACILVESGPDRFLFDCGASGLIALRHEGLDPASIETILVSHFHGDHFAGIPFLVLDAQFVSRRTAPLTIAGPPGIKERVTSAMDVLFEGLSATKQQFEIRYLELAADEQRRIGEIAVTPILVAHSGGSTPFGFRVETGGRTIAYSGDTEWTDALIDLARDADLFICECYAFDKSIPFHLNYQDLRENQHRLRCRRMVLTHASEDLLGRAASVEMEVADDGTVIEL